MDISIIIVNWNSKDYLKKCIDSILSSKINVAFEIIVIDSASYDGSDKVIKEQYPNVQYIQSDKNAGFAASNNAAFEMANGKSILFLNPDTEVLGCSIETLYRQLFSLPKAGIVGAKLLNTDGTIQTSCIQAFPTIINQILDSELLRRKFPFSRLWGTAPLFKKNPSPSIVDAVSGACLMIKRAVFLEVDKFSIDYFMYSEDIDLCHKTKKFGWKTYYVPSAKVVHHGGGSSSKNNVSVFSSVMMLESRWRFFRKTKNLLYCWLYRLNILVANVIRLAILGIAVYFFRNHKNRLSIKASVQKCLHRIQWTIGRAKWVKCY